MIGSSSCTKTIWLVTVGEPLPIDGNSPRLFRAGLLANELVKKGYKVVWWTSSFDHWAKTHRTQYDVDIDINESYKIKLIKGLGYKKNISFLRLFDHLILGIKFKKLIKHEDRPDLILCSYPTLELSKVSVSYGASRRVPVIIDVRDLWPDIFLQAFPKYFRFIGWVLLLPYQLIANSIFRGAYGITGNAPYFVDWGLKRAHRSKTIRDRCFPFAYKEIKLSDIEREKISGNLKKKGVELRSATNILYLGSINHQHDFQSVIKSAEIFQELHVDACFIFCGLGDNFERLKYQSRNLKNVIFLGWVDAKEICFLMEKSHIGIAPYITHIGFESNIPNKIIEYLSGGLAVVTTLNLGHASNFLTSKGCGISYSSNKDGALCDALNYLVSHREQMEIMRLRAKELYQTQYQAEVVYANMVNYLEELMNGCKKEA